MKAHTIIDICDKAELSQKASLPEAIKITSVKKEKDF